MPKMTNKVLGGASGKTGDLVFRQMNGETFFSTRPDHYKPTESEKLKTARKNFAVVTAFAKKINSTPQLKEVWLNVKMEGNLSFNRIIKINRKAAKDGLLTTYNKITPDGLWFSLSSLSVQNNQLNVTFNFPPENNVQFPLTLFVFLSFKVEHNNLFLLQEKIESPSQNYIYTCNIPLNDSIIEALQIDPAPIIYVAAAGLPGKNKIYWTSTLAKPLQ